MRSCGRAWLLQGFAEAGVAVPVLMAPRIGACLRPRVRGWRPKGVLLSLYEAPSSPPFCRGEAPGAKTGRPLSGFCHSENDPRFQPLVGS